jgi:cytoskeletal protein CcmA (bactofilin family)
MFGRKKGDAKKDASASGLTVQPEARPLPQQGKAPSLNLRKPLPAQPHSPSTSRIADIPGMTPPHSEVRSYGVEGKTLVVGREISLNGQIGTCDKLVVEGSVEADLEGCRQLDISPTGYFKGTADIEEADISGRFEGGLKVTKRLRIRATAHIEGSVQYGQIEIEAGGVVTGDVTHRPEPPQETRAAPEAPKPDSPASGGGG